MQGRYIALIACVFLLAGCATAAQRQYQSIATGTKALGDEAKVCTAAIYNSPDAAPLRAHVPLDAREATLAQLSDTAFATGPEIAAIEILHPRLKACQKAALDGLVNIEHQHEAEIAQRQRAAEALAQWAQTQAVLNANLNAGPSRLPAGAYQLPGPTFTNCTYGGGYANCTTQ